MDEVLAAGDVAAAGCAAFEGEQMGGGEVVDVGDVQRGVDVPGDLAVEEVEDELPGRRRPSVARSERERRQDEGDRRTLGGGPQHFVLGDVLRPLVEAEEMGDVGEAVLVGRLAATGAVEPDRPDGARVDHPLAAGAGDRVEHVAGSADVDVVEDVGVRGPEAVDGRGVEEEPAVLGRGAYAFGVADVDGAPLDVDVVEVPFVAARLDQSDDGRAPGEQRSGDGGADEAGRAGDGDPVAALQTDQLWVLGRRCDGAVTGHAGGVGGVRGRHEAAAAVDLGAPRRSALFAIVVPNSTSRPEPRWASASTSSSASTK